MPRHRRGGFSLMEVLLATSILVGSTVVLVELANQGRRNSSAALSQAQAQVLCLSRMNEIELGLLPATDQEAAPMDDAPGWVCTIETRPETTSGLTAVRVTIEQEENKLGKPQSFSLIRWLPQSSAAPGEFPSPPGERSAMTRAEAAPFGTEGQP